MIKSVDAPDVVFFEQYATMVKCSPTTKELLIYKINGMIGSIPFPQTQPHDCFNREKWVILENHFINRLFIDAFVFDKKTKVLNFHSKNNWYAIDNDCNLEVGSLLLSDQISKRFSSDVFRHSCLDINFCFSVNQTASLMVNNNDKSVDINLINKQFSLPLSVLESMMPHLSGQMRSSFQFAITTLQNTKIFFNDLFIENVSFDLLPPNRKLWIKHDKANLFFNDNEYSRQTSVFTQWIFKVSHAPYWKGFALVNSEQHCLFRMDKLEYILVSSDNILFYSSDRDVALTWNFTEPFSDNRFSEIKAKVEDEQAWGVFSIPLEKAKLFINFNQLLRTERGNECIKLFSTVHYFLIFASVLADPVDTFGQIESVLDAFNHEKTRIA